MKLEITLHNYYKLMDYTKKFFSLLLVVVSIYGCNAQKSFIDQRKSLIDISDQMSQNKSLLTMIDKYVEYKFLNNETVPEHENSFLIKLFMKKLSDLDKENYVIGDESTLSSVFKTPPSYFFMHDNRIIFIYCNTEKYVNPKLYTKDQIEMFNAKLMDDWNIYTDPTLPEGAIIKGKDGIWLSHPNYWIITKGKNKIVDYTKFKENHFLFNDPNYEYTDEMNLDSLRIHKGNINDYMDN